MQSNTQYSGQITQKPVPLDVAFRKTTHGHALMIEGINSGNFEEYEKARKAKEVVYSEFPPHLDYCAYFETSDARFVNTGYAYDPNNLALWRRDNEAGELERHDEVKTVNELLNIENMGAYPVSGRTLHENLEVKTAYKDWFPRMCEYGFQEGVDFCSKMSESTGGRPALDHSLTISMAKEIAMLQRTDKGKEVRQYLIKVEEAWNTPELLMARALKHADGTIAKLNGNVTELTAKIEQDKPKVLFADSVAASDDDILIGVLAKILNQNGANTGEKRLFQQLRADGYLISRKGSDWNMPTQKSMEMGLMRIKETSITHSNGRITTTRTPKITGKGQVYFVNRYCEATA